MNKRLMKVFFPFVAVAVGVAGMMAIGATNSDDEKKEPVDTRPTVRVESAVAQNYSVQLSSFGELEPLERTRLAAQVSGEVTHWHEKFVPGGLIARGEVLFSIEKDTYEAALMKAQADLSLAEAALIEEQARAAVAESEAKTAPKAKVTDLYLRKPQLLSARAALKSSQAQLKLAQRDLDNCEVRAPYDALVVARNLGKGQYVSQGSEVGELYNIEYAEVTFPVAGFDTAFLPERVAGLPAQVTVKGATQVYREAFIARDLGIVDSATRMSHLVARISDPYSLNSDLPPIKFGRYVEVNLMGKTLKNVYRLPQELVTNQKIWIVGPEQRLESRNVTVLREEGEFFLIRGALNNDDKVVTTLPEYPQNGMEVKLAIVDEELEPLNHQADTNTAEQKATNR
ncbi:efflux RND transporter periplasmic adaptor subunit [Marinagarivorans algicola]|uniref:efflux RND transporter periplasmic adaptor subunit n=1 Tax=Marinagarivorans algicola TaxID=1513270 RepID=UPI0037369755